MFRGRPVQAARVIRSSLSSQSRPAIPVAAYSSSSSSSTSTAPSPPSFGPPPAVGPPVKLPPGFGAAALEDKYDVLVVGGGHAGTEAAAAAARTCVCVACVRACACVRVSRAPPEPLSARTEAVWSPACQRVLENTAGGVHPSHRIHHQCSSVRPRFLLLSCRYIFSLSLSLSLSLSHSRDRIL